MEDARYTTELIKKHQAGVPVRVLMDPRANADYPLNAARLSELQNAGIPMRKRLTSYILHWKMMLFHGQNVVEFSGANYSADAWRPGTAIPYENYTDEAIYFTSDTAIVNSFRTKFDDHWINTTRTGRTTPTSRMPLVRHYDIFPKDPSLNFPPTENYRTRSVNAYKAEKRKIDVIMYRITDRQHTDNDPGGGRARHPGAADHRAGAVPPAQPDVALLERRSAVHGRRADQAPRACRPEPPEVGDPLRPERHDRRATRAW